MSNLVSLNKCRLPQCTNDRDVHIGGSFCRDCMLNTIRRCLLYETGINLTKNTVEAAICNGNTRAIGDHLKDRIKHWHEHVKKHANELIKKEEAAIKTRGLPADEYI